MSYSSVSSKINVKNLSTTNKTNLNNITNQNTDFDEIDYNVPLGDIFTGDIDYSNIKKDGFTVQGMSRVGDEMFISAYSHTDNSRIYIYDLKTGKFEGYMKLNNDAHVGGTTFDKENEILYVTGNKGEVNAYDYSRIRKIIHFPEDSEGGMLIDLTENNKDILDVSALIINYKSEKDIDGFKFINSADKVTISELGSAATTYYYDNKLYVATFEGREKGTLRVYDVKVEKDEFNNKSIVVSNDYKDITIPERVQGIALTNYNGKQYLVVTESVGFAKSKIEVFEFDGDKTKLVNYKYVPRGLEGIYIDDDNTVTAVYENSKTEPLKTTMEDLLKIDGSILTSSINDPLAYLGGTMYELGTMKKFDEAGKEFGKIDDDWGKNMDKYGFLGVFPSLYDTAADIGIGAYKYGGATIELAGTVAWDGIKGFGGLISKGFHSIFK